MRLNTERYLLPCFPEARFFRLPECSPEAESSLALYSDFRHIVISGRQEFLKAQYNRFSDREHSRMGPSLLLHKNPAGMMPPDAFELVSTVTAGFLIGSQPSLARRMISARFAFGRSADFMLDFVIGLWHHKSEEKRIDAVGRDCTAGSKEERQGSAS